MKLTRHCRGYTYPTDAPPAASKLDCGKKNTAKLAANLVDCSNACADPGGHTANAPFGRGC